MDHKEIKQFVHDLITAYIEGGAPAVEDTFPDDVQIDFQESEAFESPEGDLIIVSSNGKSFRLAITEIA